MNRSDYYMHYQSNIELLDLQINQVKKATQKLIGKKDWQERQSVDLHQIQKSEKEIRACTRLFSFLICSWLEARLMKILYENSSSAFSDTEITQIRELNNMASKWKTSFLLAVCKSYGFTYSDSANYSSSFPIGSMEQQNYLDICGLFADISDAITVRNRLAHGQWEIQFNSGNTAVASYDFFTKYENIQKLDILKQCFNEIAEIISAYVTYKDKRNPNFNRIVHSKLQSIFNKKIRIQNSDFRKYTSNLGQRYERHRNLKITDEKKL